MREAWNEFKNLTYHEIVTVVCAILAALIVLGAMIRIASGEELEATKTISFQELVHRGLRAHFEEMLAPLKVKGCITGRGEAMTNPENQDEIILFLRCVEFKQATPTSAP